MLQTRLDGLNRTESLLAEKRAVLELEQQAAQAEVKLPKAESDLAALNKREASGETLSDADAADKAARFMQLCSNFGIPLVGLVDTPGFMVGPAVEEKAQVRHSSRMFIAAAHLRVPYFSVVLRKGYGLGAMAMTAGGFHSPMSTVSWPTGEFGGMGIEGFVRLGYRKELEAQPEGPQRDALFQRLVRERYESGGAIPMAQTLELDAVIDPADTRNWLVGMLAAAPLVTTTGDHTVDSW